MKKKPSKPKRPRVKIERARRKVFQVDGKSFGVTPVALKLTANVPDKPHVHRSDIINFINASGRAYVDLYFKRSPFIAGNGPESFRVTTVVPKQIDSATVPGSYPSQKTFSKGATVSGPPDGPSVVVE